MPDLPHKPDLQPGRPGPPGPGASVLALGFSSIVSRRVLPALASLAGVGQVHLASRRALPADVLPETKRGRVFQGYDRALK